MERITLIAIISVFASAAFAQDYHDFESAKITGVTVTSLGSNEYQVSLSANAMVDDGKDHYTIDDITGFYTLNKGSSKHYATTDQNDWEKQNPSEGVSGWAVTDEGHNRDDHDSHNKGIGMGKELTFTFSSTVPPLNFDTHDWGFDFRLDKEFDDHDGHNCGFDHNHGNDNGNYFKFGPQAVPEPASMLALGLSAVGVFLKRKKN